MKHFINTIEFRKLNEKQKAEVIALIDTIERDKAMLPDHSNDENPLDEFNRKLKAFIEEHIDIPANKAAVAFCKKELEERDYDNDRAEMLIEFRIAINSAKIYRLLELKYFAHNELDLATAIKESYESTLHFDALREIIREKKNGLA